MRDCVRRGAFADTRFRRGRKAVRADKRKTRTVDVGSRHRAGQTAPSRDARQIQRVVPGQVKLKQIKDGEFLIGHDYTIHIY